MWEQRYSDFNITRFIMFRYIFPLSPLCAWAPYLGDSCIKPFAHGFQLYPKERSKLPKIRGHITIACRKGLDMKKLIKELKNICLNRKLFETEFTSTSRDWLNNSTPSRIWTDISCWGRRSKDSTWLWRLQHWHNWSCTTYLYGVYKSVFSWTIWVIPIAKRDSHLIVDSPSLDSFSSYH